MRPIQTLLRKLSALPVAARWCVVLAVANAGVWSVVTPPFHVPDENAHFAYVQYLAETGDAPGRPEAPVYSSQEAELLDALVFNGVVGRPRDRTIVPEGQQRLLDAAGGASVARANGGGLLSNSNQPPLYYGMQAGVYLASPSQDLLDRMAVMRLLSALLAGLTTLFVFLFLRETFSQPWAWTVGALVAGLQPLFAFLSGGVTPDALFFCASAGLVWALARAFNRGLSPVGGAMIGGTLAVGILAKLSFAALVPGAVVGLTLLVVKGRGHRSALYGAGLALAGLLLFLAAYVAMNTLVWDRDAFGGGGQAAVVNTAGGQGADPISWREQLAYVWQLYLPRLPFMSEQFEQFQPWETWFKGWTGKYGWLDTSFPPWVYNAALGLVAPMAALLAVGVVRGRGKLVRRWRELLTYTTLTAGLMLAIGLSGIRFRSDSGIPFEQARYLLPLLPFYAAAVVIACRGAGERFSRPVAAGVVVLVLGHGLFSQMLVVARFYG